MSIKCVHCGGRHAKVETVRQCAEDAGVVPILPKRNMWLPTTGPIAPVRHLPGEAPAGYYWLEGNVVVKIRIPADGRWKGRYFVVACDRLSNTEKLVFSKNDREEFLQWLTKEKTNLMTAFMLRYGGTTGYCPACGGRMDSSETRMGRHDGKGPYGLACSMSVHGRYTTQGD